MTEFMGKDFLLDTETARVLYHDYAAAMPIIDYHCHIDAAEINGDKRFADLAQLWLGGDHYKWRLMRACGVPEEYITGHATTKEKFMAFAGVLPRAVASPIYHWVHLELQRFFGCSIPLCPGTAEEIWEITTDKLRNDPSLSAKGIIRRMDVKVIVTTDDPADDLRFHKKIYDIGGTRVLPCFRPDRAMNIESKGFAGYIANLGRISGFDGLKTALLERIEHFDSFRCKAADHGIYKLTYAPASDKEVCGIFSNALKGKPVSIGDAEKYRFALLSFLAGEYTRLNWVMELHLGAVRDVNTPMKDSLGADTGFDCIGTSIDIPQLAKVLDALNTQKILPKTLIFSINPNDNAALNTLCACFSENGIAGKVQQGSAWWFNDSSGGIKAQLQSFAEHGVLANFIGMLTDSRSFTSYTRHEYFRRILCGFLGCLADSGQYPNDIKYLGKIVQDICYNNVKGYFEF